MPRQLSCCANLLLDWIIRIHIRVKGNFTRVQLWAHECCVKGTLRCAPRTHSVLTSRATFFIWRKRSCQQDKLYTAVQFVTQQRMDLVIVFLYILFSGEQKVPLIGISVNWGKRFISPVSTRDLMLYFRSSLTDYDINMLLHTLPIRCPTGRVPSIPVPHPRESGAHLRPQGIAQAFCGPSDPRHWA